VDNLLSFSQDFNHRTSLKNEFSNPKNLIFLFFFHLKTLKFLKKPQYIYFNLKISFNESKNTELK
jgi:hypothetical protein